MEAKQEQQYQMDLGLRCVSQALLNELQPEFKAIGILAVVARIDHSDSHPAARAVLPLAMAQPKMAGTLMQEMNPAVLRSFNRLCYKLLEATEDHWNS